MMKTPTERSYREWLQTAVPRTWSVNAPHHRAIAEHIDAVERGDLDRLAIFMPPRHSKTESVTVRYPVYTLMANPQRHVLLTAYNERFAHRLGRKSRSVGERFLKLDVRTRAADEWHTAQGGLVMTRGVGSPPTGTGFDRIIIDDPIRSREDAESETYREKAWDWYTDDLYTRLEPGGAIILVMTQWHEDDISVRAIASEPNRWTVLRLPALAEEEDAIGRKPGEALWAERWSVEQLLRIRDVMAQNEGLRSWEALYQCNPTPREGSFFKVTQIGYADELPAMTRQVRAWDLAASTGDGDQTVGARMGLGADGKFYVTDIVSGNWLADEVRNKLLQTAGQDGRSVAIHLPQDPGQAGKDQAQQLTRLLAGYAVKSEPVSGSKEVRAGGFAAQVNAGNVVFLRSAWTANAVQQLRVFPGGKRDDIVDALADAFNEIVVARKASYGKRLL